MQNNLNLPWVRGLTATLLLVGISTPAFAYIDPGTGSLIIQTVIGAIAAIGVTMKIYWHKLRLMFSGKSKDTEATSTNGAIATSDKESE